MRFTLDKENLIEALSLASAAISKKNLNIPILQNIKLEVKSNVLYLTGTDLDTTIKVSKDVNSSVDGSTTVPAQMLCDIVKKMGDGVEVDVAYKEDENDLAISAGKINFKLHCLSAEDFPTFEDVEISTAIDLPKSELIAILDKTRFAVSTDETRYYLNGLFLHTKPKEEDAGEFDLVGTSTDGHKLAVVKAINPNPTQSFDGVIIPKKTIGEIRKTLDSVGESVRVLLSKTKIRVEIGNTVLTSKLIDAEFPDYQRVIPTENNKVLKVDKKVFSSAIDRVSTIVMDKNRSVKFVMADNNLTLEANAAENGDATEDIKVDFPFEDKIEIGFNARYLLDIIAQVESDMLELKLKDNFSPIIIKGSEEPNNTFVLMPVRI